METGNLMHAERLAALDGLRQLVVGTVARPGEQGYQHAIPWNVAAEVNPGAVVSVASATDVAHTVRFAAGCGLTVAVQATGHGALSIGRDTILIHTGEMVTCAVDPTRRTASVGAGVRWQQVLDAATPHGLAPLTGSAPAVGVVGFLTGGGIGPLVRTFGASSDYIRSFNVVTGAGQLLHATAEDSNDLFWGLRGGKATLGIVTAVEIDLLPISELYGGAIYFEGQDAAKVLHCWREWSANLPEQVNTSLAFLRLPPLPSVPAPLAGRFSVAVRYAALGDVGAAEELLRPIRDVAGPLMDSVTVMPYSSIGMVHADPVDPMPIYERTVMLQELSAEAADAVIAVVGPQSACTLTIVELRLLGGALSSPAAPDSALCHRGMAYVLHSIGVLDPSVAGSVVDHSGALVDALSQWSTGAELPNFAPASDAARLARCYDENTLHRLAALAEHYDPAGVLRVGQVARVTRT